jgi:isopenicillin-N N-acyltransferase-like protein
MIVMEPMLGTMEVAMLPALNRTFSSYTLDMEIQRPSAQVQSTGNPTPSYVKAV